MSRWNSFRTGSILCFFFSESTGIQQVIIDIMITKIMIIQFYNREKELALMRLLKESTPSFLVITGKRRVGKTEFIKQFIKDQRSLYLFVDSNKSIDTLYEAA